MPITMPVNPYQEEYNSLCKLGGGRNGGPARTKVQELLLTAEMDLNHQLEEVATGHLKRLPDRNPWHVCFAIGLIWGHLARESFDFVAPASELMSDWNDDLLRETLTHNRDRGRTALEQALKGGWMMFDRACMPEKIPASVDRIRKIQDRWFSILTKPGRPPYIGNWNATALFMAAVFAHKSIWSTSEVDSITLPPGGPVQSALQILHDDNYISKSPARPDQDGGAFDPAVLVENQELMRELKDGIQGATVLDMHSGLYCLGTQRA